MPSDLEIIADGIMNYKMPPDLDEEVRLQST
jgi:hypothetical protein